jgi:hypothetical protein
MNSGLTIAQANNQAQMVMNPRDPSRDWGPSALNAPHQFTASFRYQLPFGHNQMWMNGMSPVADKIFGGWQVNGIVTLLSGFPFTPVVGSNRSGDGDIRNPDRPNANPAFSGPVILGDPNGWFDPHAFSLPTIGTWGNMGRGTFLGPGMATADLSLFKNIPLNDRTSLQVRAEAFNALNRTNFGSPNPTVFAGASVSPTAGLITDTATTSRQIQFGMKLIF